MDANVLFVVIITTVISRKELVLDENSGKPLSNVNQKVVETKNQELIEKE